MLKHSGTLEIVTERLVLRQFATNDAKDMFYNWANDDQVTKYLTWPTHEDINTSIKVTLDWVNAYQKDDYYQWAIELKEGNKVIGSIAVVNYSNENEHCELGYCIGKAFWNQGITTEALRAVIQFVFNVVGFNRIEAIHHSENVASGCVMRNVGMTYEGCKREFHKNLNGNFVDCESYAILKADKSSASKS